MTTSSRITYAFARDKGLPFSDFFAKVDKRFDVPINSLVLTNIIVVVFGCIYLGSSSALNAILSASVVALGVSYEIPIGVLVCRGRSILPQERQFRMRNIVGWISNIVSLIFTGFTTILFLFPPQIPVTLCNMNYTVVAFGIIFIVALLQWILDGRKNYHGPHISVLGGDVQTNNDLA
jgi:amino acid transporter